MADTQADRLVLRERIRVWTFVSATRAVRRLPPNPLAGGIGSRRRRADAPMTAPGHPHGEEQPGCRAGVQRRHEGNPTAPPLTVLVVGANGLIGSALAERLERAGHAVIRAMRHVTDDAGPGRRVALDLARPCPDQWMDVLRTVDVVVNAAGIFRETDDVSFEQVHVSGPRRLSALAAAAGVTRIVQISALGAHAQAATAYWRSKAAGDACATAFPGRSIVIRPSLVFAECGASTRLFLTLAAQPIIALPGGGGQVVQPIHLDDLLDGVTALIEHPDPRR
ncbi:NAD-dependent epimerase/dehydratase family protein [Luteimonas sp. TWI1416]|uniref:NAD-dependent epimerase/dehydratase family protein n=1 Tax=unclassified Luteimonas TaxID=2629088 RepID=UPI00320AB57B